jgi:hypothetical protein
MRMFSCARRGLESKLQMNDIKPSKVQEVIGEEGFTSVLVLGWTLFTMRGATPDLQKKIHPASLDYSLQQNSIGGIFSGYA